MKDWIKCSKMPQSPERIMAVLAVDCPKQVPLENDLDVIEHTYKPFSRTRCRTESTAKTAKIEKVLLPEGDQLRQNVTYVESTYKDIETDRIDALLASTFGQLEPYAWTAVGPEPADMGADVATDMGADKRPPGPPWEVAGKAQCCRCGIWAPPATTLLEMADQSMLCSRCCGAS